jgi:hypothetical protein
VHARVLIRNGTLLHMHRVHIRVCVCWIIPMTVTMTSVAENESNFVALTRTRYLYGRSRIYCKRSTRFVSFCLWFLFFFTIFIGIMLQLQFYGSLFLLICTQRYYFFITGKFLKNSIVVFASLIVDIKARKT